MDKDRQKRYEPPRLTTVAFKAERGFANSFSLGRAWTDNGDDPWNGTASNSGNDLGGWTDNGASAW